MDPLALPVEIFEVIIDLAVKLRIDEQTAEVLEAQKAPPPTSQILPPDGGELLGRISLVSKELQKLVCQSPNSAQRWKGSFACPWAFSPQTTPPSRESYREMKRALIPLQLAFLTSSRLTIYARPNDCLLDLKRRLELLNRCPPNYICKWIFSGKIYRDSDVFSSLNLKPNDFMVVMLRKA